jgi:hypothetical protein
VLEATRATWDFNSFHFNVSNPKTGNLKPLPGAEKNCTTKLKIYHTSAE